MVTMVQPDGTAREILAATAAALTQRRRAEVADLECLLAWADLHAGDPQDQPDAVPIRYGGPRLIQSGGEGTPEVVDLCLGEIAIARHAGLIATQHACADALDLRHRLPRLWAATRELACEPWVARRVARMTRALSPAAATIVDAAVAGAVHTSPARLLAIAEAKTIEADQALHAQRIAQAQARRGVWFSRPRVGESADPSDGIAVAGTQVISGRLEEADAVDLDTFLDEIADLLAHHGDHHPDREPTHQELRAQALGLLAHPDRLAALLATDTHTDTDTDTHTEVDAKGEGEGPPARRRRDAVVYVHLSAAAITGTNSTNSAYAGVARVEDLGPLLLDQLTRLLRHRHITLKPVIDLNQVQAVDGYEHPTRIRERTLLRTGGEVFPHTTSPPRSGPTGTSPTGTAGLDHDHPTPYQPTGPPGQTGDHNHAPLRRRSHRMKTHAGFGLDQLQLAVYRWTTPHGLVRVVTPTGTRTCEPLTDRHGRIIGEIY